jgi:hypothetical protein
MRRSPGGGRRCVHGELSFTGAERGAGERVLFALTEAVAEDPPHPHSDLRVARVKLTERALEPDRKAAVVAGEAPLERVRVVLPVATEDDETWPSPSASRTRTSTCTESIESVSRPASEMLRSMLATAPCGDGPALSTPGTSVGSKNSA